MCLMQDAVSRGDEKKEDHERHERTRKKEIGTGCPSGSAVYRSGSVCRDLVVAQTGYSLGLGKMTDDGRWTGEWVDPSVPDERGHLLGALPPPSPSAVAFAWMITSSLLMARRWRREAERLQAELEATKS